MTGFELGRLPEDDEELWQVVRAMWGVSIPREKVCPDHIAPFTAFADAYFRRNSLDPDSDVRDIALWHGSRGLSGKSFMLSILGLTVAHLLGSDVNLLGGSLAQSTNIHQHMRSAMEYPGAPRYMITAESSTLIRLTNRAKIHALTASQRTVRGPHPPTLLCDEIDEMDIEILDAALGQPLPQVTYLGTRVRPFAVMCSTWQNPEGTFTEIRRRAEERGYPIYSWCFLETSAGETGWLDEETIAEKRRSIPTEMWRVEYELGEPSIGNRAFDTESVDKAFGVAFAPEKEPAEGGYVSKKLAKDYEEYTFAEPVKQAAYVAGADWGKEQDKTVIWVARIDGPQRELVYYLRVNRRPYPVMIGAYNAVLKRYDVGHNAAWHDSTGLGNVVNDYLDIRARPFPMTGDKRAVMLSDYVNAIEKGAWKIPRIKSAYLEMKYARYGDLYFGQRLDFHLPDTVCAGALAEYAAKRATPVVMPIVVGRDDTPTKHQEQFLPKPGSEEARLVSEAPISLLA